MLLPFNMRLAVDAIAGSADVLGTHFRIRLRAIGRKHGQHP